MGSSSIVNVHSPAKSQEIKKLFDNGFITFFVRDRLYFGKYRIKLSFSNYHFVEVIDSMDCYHNTVAKMLSTVLNHAIGIDITDDISYLRNQLIEYHKMSFRISDYRSKTQMIIMSKLITVRRDYNTNVVVNHA